MQTRLLLPNRSADARWGYLDRYAVNPQMPRALLASLGLVLATLGASRWVRHDTVMLEAAPYSFTGSTRVLPVPRIEPTPLPLPRHVFHPHTSPALRRPVPAPGTDEAWDPQPSAGGTVTDAGASVAGEDPDVAVAPGDAPGTETWPSPEDFIPVEQEPALVAMPAPAYPEVARDAGIEGTVLLRVLVGEDGFVHKALVLQSVLGLDESALAAARGAVFRPAVQQERPVAVWIVVPVEFRLHE